MFINNKNKCIPILGALSERIYELIGTHAGNTNEVSVAYLELPSNASTSKHYHPNMIEVYYVLDGRAEILLNNKIIEINKNDVILIERNTTHQLMNNSDKTLHLLTISTPAWTPIAEVAVT
ncbi:MAG: cupin domain-containing protein [Gammaproteobacteria bacterium]|nr:MAG: cupin domain-containing protein [Gammaproteobacteria bacterium]